VRKSELKRSTPLKSATGWSAMDTPRTPLKRTKRKKSVWLSAHARQTAWARSGARCTVCHKWASLQIHHVLPKSQWPEHAHAIDNLVAVCAGCHDNHERAHRRIRYEELPEQVRTWVRTLGGREEIYMERTYPR
jgi:5-methylcytosine-specific restriction endonuclease McrA